MRKDIVFTSQGIECRGWLYVPDGLKGRAPAIVMANAISAIKEITLPGYAARFEDAGFVVLVFDYRHYGASGGEPRNHIVPFEQMQDVRNAITWLRTQPRWRLTTSAVGEFPLGLCTCCTWGLMTGA